MSISAYPSQSGPARAPAPNQSATGITMSTQQPGGAASGPPHGGPGSQQNLNSIVRVAFLCIWSCPLQSYHGMWICLDKSLPREVQPYERLSSPSHIHSSNISFKYFLPWLFVNNDTTCGSVLFCRRRYNLLVLLLIFACFITSIFHTHTISTVANVLIQYAISRRSLSTYLKRVTTGRKLCFDRNPPIWTLKVA